MNITMIFSNCSSCLRAIKYESTMREIMSQDTCLMVWTGSLWKPRGLMANNEAYLENCIGSYFNSNQKGNINRIPNGDVYLTIN